MKKLIVFLLLPVLFSCGEYQKVLNGNDPVKQYSLASKFFEKGKYARAEKLYALAEPYYKDKPQYERLLFRHALSLFKLKQYFSAGYKFRRFTVLFPNSSKREEAEYYIVKSYYHLTPEYYRDLTYGEKTLEEAERFLSMYPEGKFSKEIKEISAEIIHRFHRKGFEDAKLYYDLGYFKSAIKALNNFMSEYPGSPYREQAMFYRFMAAADLALNSVESKQDERLKKALEYYEKFVKFYPQSKWKNKAEQKKQKLDKLNQQEIAKK